jgi:hypothetical protein
MPMFQARSGQETNSVTLKSRRDMSIVSKQIKRHILSTRTNNSNIIMIILTFMHAYLNFYNTGQSQIAPNKRTPKTPNPDEPSTDCPSIAAVRLVQSSSEQAYS